MSKLSDLLNPAPAVLPPSSPPTLSARQAHGYHDRHPSITSPLEALALAATTSSPTHSPSYPKGSAFTSPKQLAMSRTTASENQQPTGSDTIYHPQSEIPRSSSEHDAIETIKSGPVASVPVHPTSVSRNTSLSPAYAMRHEEDPPKTETSIAARKLDVTAYCPIPENQPDTSGFTQQEEVESVEGRGNLQSNLKTERADDPSTISADDLPLQNLQARFVSEHSVLDSKAFISSPTAAARQSSPIATPHMISGEDRKRPAPKGDKKKGTASSVKKPAVKKRKIEVESKDGTPFSQRSATPSSSRASKTPAPWNHAQESSTPTQSSPPPTVEEDEEDGEDRREVFCICRKPDDHTWMIGCDGGCEDWFHGRCINMNQQDAVLINKYICPNCTAKGVGVTTWKPMCRLDSCREPARVSGPMPSKYCSDDHGELYMAQKALGKTSKRSNISRATTAKKRRRDNFTDNIGNGDDINESVEDQGDDLAHLRGGLLQASELKALISGVKDLHEFKRLGEGIASLVGLKKEDDGDVEMGDNDPGARQIKKIEYTADEQSQLAQISAKKDLHKRVLERMISKEKFLGLIKASKQSMLEGLKKEGFKDICGYDSRLSWSDPDFDEWCNSGEGRNALESGELYPSAPPEDATVDGDGMQGETEAGVCQKKKCERHKQWYKVAQSDIGLEREGSRQELRKLEAEEKEVDERAVFRHLEASGGSSDETLDDEPPLIHQ